MRKRIASTVALWSVLIFAIYYGKTFGFFVLILLLGIFSMAEMCAMLRKCGCNPLGWFAQAGGVLIMCAPMLSSITGLNCAVSGALMLGALAFVLVLWSLKRPDGDFIEKTIIPTFIALAIVSFLLQWLVVISVEFSFSQYSGVIIALWVIASAKFTDVGGYAVGAALGRHRLCPNVSPNKSWEGLFGGLLSSMAVSVLFVYFFGEDLPDVFTVWVAAFASIPIGLAGLFSDLLESLIKRRAQIKDSSALIPGIGGALDLSDSMLLSSPVAYLILTLIF